MSRAAMQKDLVTATSLFCDAGTPVAGAAAGVHDRDNKNVIGKHSINDGIRITVKQAAPNPSEFGTAQREAGNLIKNSLGFVRKAVKRRTKTLVFRQGVFQLKLGFRRELDSHLRRRNRRFFTFSQGIVLTSPLS